MNNLLTLAGFVAAAVMLAALAAVRPDIAGIALLVCALCTALSVALTPS